VHAGTDPVQAWVARFNGTKGLGGVLVDVVVDSLGNVYVAISSIAGVYDSDFVIVKYGPNGQLLWFDRYDGPANDRDSPAAIAIDVSGNVYVTGQSVGIGTRYDYATIKYDGTGKRLWVARYDGPLNWDDEPCDIAVDVAGNVFVTGKSDHEFWNEDYATVKYDSSGNQLWVARYDDPDSKEDTPVGVVVDGIGSVYVTGSSERHVSPLMNDLDYATIKYDSSGSQLWLARFDCHYGDEATAISLSPTGGVIVTGESRGPSPGDYVTVMYDSSGSQQWNATYNGLDNLEDQPVAMVVDANGNAYVTGWSKSLIEGNPYQQCATVKYSSSGSQVWIAKYTPGWGSTRPCAIGKDAFGNVYVTATNSYDGWVTLKLSASGSQLWVRNYGSMWDSAIDMAVDDAGNTYSVGDIKDLGGTALKYDTYGNQQWVASFEAPVKDVPYGMAADPWGNVYVAGRSGGWSVLVKYDSAGNQMWVRSYPMRISAIVVDCAGNAYVTGGPSFRTVKYDSDGNELWSASYESPYFEALHDEAVAVAVDAGGNVYVTGESAGDGKFDPVPGGLPVPDELDWATVKFDSLGHQVWATRYNDPIKGLDVPSAIAVDDAGYVYVTGVCWLKTFNNDYLTLKYSPAGVEIWNATYNGPADGDDEAVAIGVDKTGNVYVTGKSDGSAPEVPDYATIKYNTMGNQMWVARYDGPAGGYDEPSGLALDSFGHVVVTGQSVGLNSKHDFATVNYGSDGSLLWLARYDGPLSSWDGATGVTVDEWGNVYVTGKSWKNDALYDYATIKYSSSGGQIWVSRYDGSVSGRDEPIAIVMDGWGNLLVTGKSDGGNTGFDFVTIKYEMVLQPQEGVQLLIKRVNGLVASRLLNEGQGKSLNVKLERALSLLQAQKNRMASSQLVAFTNQMNSLMDSGDLSRREGTPFVNTANAIIRTL
jgi:hypothetical protein